VDEIIRAEDLAKKYMMGDQVVNALCGVSLAVERGQFLVIMGASGSGKSTLMHIIGCLDHPTSGTLWIDGEDISKVHANRLAELRNNKIGFVFQQFNLLPRTTAANNVELPLLYSGVGAGERKRRARESLEKVGLGKRTGHFPSQLSGGEQQRVAIARALVNDPPIIMADEPTGNLDSTTSEAVHDLFFRICQQFGTTIIVVTHNTKLAQSMPRVVTMRDGRIFSDERRALSPPEAPAPIGETAPQAAEPIGTV
jgi:putative ABC transport system ATP-binding protein